MNRILLTIIASIIAPSLALPILDPIGFEHEAQLSSTGTEVTVSGTLWDCKPNEKTTEVQVSLLQDSTLASARGTAQISCQNDSFVVETESAEGTPLFQEGPAQACALAVRRGEKKVADLRFWCGYVDLVLEQ